MTSTDQLEFSLLALRDDPLPSLQSSLLRAQNSGDVAEAAEIISKISSEHSKRERWSVRFTFLLFDMSFDPGCVPVRKQSSQTQPCWSCPCTSPWTCERRYIVISAGRSRKNDAGTD